MSFFKNLVNGGFSPFAWISALLGKNTQSGLSSIYNKFTGAGLTGAEQEANRFSAEEAQKQRDWQEEMSNTAYQRQVADMQKAGINPALMYGGAGASGASTPSGAGASSISPGTGLDPVSAIMDMALLGAQVENIKADTRQKNAGATGQEITNANLDAQQKAAIASSLASAESSKADTLYKNLLIEYGMPEAEVNKVLNDINVGQSTISRNDAEAELAKANAAYTEVLKKINVAKLPYELASMSASAREAKARAIVDEFRGAYMKQNGTDVPSGTIASLVGLISSTFHSINSEPSSGWDELNTRTLFPFIDMILNAFGK